MTIAAADVEVDVERIMARLRAEYADIEEEVASEDAARKVAAADDLALARLPESAGAIEIKSRYRLADFLRYHDEDFVANAYRAILRREPDVQGFAGYLDRLRTGQLAKTEIVGRMRYSREGRSANVPIGGLFVPYALRTARRIPVLGRALGIAQYLLRLPDLVRNLERLEAVVLFHYFDTNRRVNAAEAAVEKAFAVRKHNVADAMRALETAAEQRDRSSQGRLTAVETHFLSDFEHLRRTTGDRADALDAELGRIEGRMASAGRQLAALRNEFDGKVGALNVVLAFKADSERLTMLANALVDALDRKAEKSEITERLAAADSELREALRAIEAVDRMKADKEQLQTVVDATSELRSSKADAAMLDAAVRNIEQHFANLVDEQRARDRQVADLRQRLGEELTGIERQQQDWKREFAHVRRLSATRGHPPDTRLYDTLYASFEDRFRGSREEILERVRAYLPIVRAAGAGAADAPVLDLGCGRGEWLELLHGEQLRAQGVDINAVTVAECVKAGLDVTQADAFAYLRKLKQGSVGAVTAFHVVEHMSFEHLILLMDEVLRALRPGGVAILETPNPENVTVGAHTFYVDPTHHRPIPPTTLHFLAEARGFSAVEVIRLHPYPVSDRINEGHPAIAEFINGQFFGPRDYAVIARK